MNTFVCISIFGLAGVWLRYLMVALFAPANFSSFPWVTFLINVLGSLLIGMVYSAGVEKSLFSEAVRLGLSIGLLGGFTTFSSFSLENRLLMESGHGFLALSYSLLSVLLGILAAALGMQLIRSVLH